ncbi:MAG: hypothetical protein J5833_00505 [Victivallales bacterium]|nr:hypothetical protein [Victivallales bacterium]
MIRLNIVPLLIDHVDEICEEQLQLFRSHAIDSVAFMFTMVPEGNPPYDKAGELSRRFKAFQEKLKGSGMPVGILMQATMGHGWLPSEVTPYQKIVRIDGSSQYTFCPDSKEFREYVADAVRKCASAAPDFMMLDDDTRFITGRNACFCPLHTARYNNMYGTSYSSEELRRLAKEDKDVAAKFDAMLLKSMEEYMWIIRKAIDSVNPDITCNFCQCLHDYQHAPTFTRILAGKGKPVLRINHGLYMQDSPRNIPEGWIYNTARQINYAPKDFTLLCEPDTCPQNRYSTSAAFMRSHLTLSVLEGCKGGKLWITRTGSFEPDSGKAYRKALADDGCMLEEISKLSLTWKGPAIPFTRHPAPMFPVGTLPWSSWNYAFGRMGLPFSFSDGPAEGRLNLLTHEQALSLTDDELKAVLAGSVLLDGSAAIALSKRGFGKWCGFNATEWSRERVILERWNGKTISIPGSASFAQMEKLGGAEELSTLFHRGYAFSNSEENVGPGSLYFENELGGKVVTTAIFYGFRGDVGTHDPFGCYGVFNETRKRQYLDFMSRLTELELYHDGDAEVMLRYALNADGSRIVYVYNAGLDVLEEMTFRGGWAADAKPQVLGGDGKWRIAQYGHEGGALTIKHATLPARVTVMKF